MTDDEIQPEEQALTLLRPAVESALTAASSGEEDAGARALALRYAELLDAAVPTRDMARAVRIVSSFLAGNLSDTTPQEREVATAWDRISSALAEHSVASDLGPKLLASLTAVGATLAGRKDKSAGAGGTVLPMKSPLEQARDEARAARAYAMGASGA